MPREHRTAKALRVLLVPPDPALAVLLGLQPDIEVVPTPVQRPHVALVDSVAAVADVADQAPECRTLLLAGSAHPGLWDTARAVGAAGLVLRDGPVEDLADAVRRASMGDTVVDPALG
ncbi:DNA-binding response regulator [Streptomyces sp. NPDC090022]|uniref:DNA-binding response regulator n=1 Tax=Streptomyces sp. NPDC090022 TaxID=3365920 RepID=UPI00382ECC74